MLARLSHHAIGEPIWKRDEGGGWGFWGFSGGDATMERKTVVGRPDSQGLASQNRCTSPCGYFSQRAPLCTRFFRPARVRPGAGHRTAEIVPRKDNLRPSTPKLSAP